MRMVSRDMVGCAESPLATWLVALASAITLSIGHTSIAREPMAALRDGEYHAVLNGVNEWYRVAGAANHTTPMVIVHGGPGGNSYEFEHTIGPRLERFSTVVYYDQRGSGHSAVPTDDGAYTIPILVSDIEALRANLGVERVTLLGFSFGGWLAAEYAIAHPEHVERLILQSSMDGDLARMTTYQTYAFAFMATGQRRVELESLAHAAITDVSKRIDDVWNNASRADIDHLLFQSMAVAAEVHRLEAESGERNTGKMLRVLLGTPYRQPALVDDLRKLSVAALVMVGAHDRNVGVDVSHEIADALPHARYVVFGNSAHFPEMEEPEKYASTVRDFLRGELGR